MTIEKQVKLAGNAALGLASATTEAKNSALTRVARNLDAGGYRMRWIEGAGWWRGEGG